MTQTPHTPQPHEGVDYPAALKESRWQVRLNSAASSSYARHCGERAVEAAEGDLLGELLRACKGLIVALRMQVNLARDLGGDIAMNEGNYDAWQQAEAAIAKAAKT